MANVAEYERSEYLARSLITGRLQHRQRWANFQFHSSIFTLLFLLPTTVNTTGENLAIMLSR